jgi:hypothetical protein
MAKNLICSVLTLILFFGCASDTSQAVKKEPISHLEMSETVLKLIPESPSYIPSKPQQDSAKALLSKVYRNNQIEFATTDTIEFVDQGENFESVSCNLCGKTIDVEYWQIAMDTAFQNHFEDLAFNTPCCNKQTSLNALYYHSAAGFSKFVIIVTNPETKIQPKDLEDLQQVLGTKLKTVWAHY